MEREIRQSAPLDPRVYDGLQGFTTQPFTEANVKNGTQFTLSDEIIVTTGSTVYRSFKTSAVNDTLIKTRIINTDGGMRYTPMKASVFTAGAIVDYPNAPLGSGIIVNLNGKSSNVSAAEYRGTPALVTDEGYAFDVVRSTTGVGSNRQQGIFEGLGIERVLNRDTEYLLKFENLDNKDVYVVFSLTWYEGPLSVDI